MTYVDPAPEASHPHGLGILHEHRHCAGGVPEDRCPGGFDLRRSPDRSVPAPSTPSQIVFCLATAPPSGPPSSVQTAAETQKTCPSPTVSGAPEPLRWCNSTSKWSARARLLRPAPNPGQYKPQTLTSSQFLPLLDSGHQAPSGSADPRIAERTRGTANERARQADSLA